MNKLVSFVVFLFLASSLVAQPKVCKDDFQKAVSLQNKGEYKAAATAFEKAAKCPGFMATERNQCLELANKCINLAKRASSKGGNSKLKTGVNESSKPKGKAEAERHFSGYLRATCNGSIRGAQMNVLVSAKNLTDNKLTIRCLISPRDGSGRVNTESPIAGDYTIEGGLSGQEQEVTFANEEEWVEVNFFVPFAVMDLAGNFAPQMMKSDLYFFQKGTRTPLAEYHDVYDALSPHTISLDGRTSDYPIDVNWLGGFGELHPAVCGGNEAVWSNLPPWVTVDNEGVHIDENDSPSARSATLHVSSSEGGNVININVNQQGREAGQGPTAKINNVWKENGRPLIHVDCEVTGARGKELRVYAVFYCSDGTTPLRDMDGDEIRFYAKALASFTESAFEDIPIKVNNYLLNNSINSSGRSGIYYICISEDKGKSWMAKSGPYTISW